ncbi:hypothetical protein U27_03841 [Candidatus Vecturithrix granuli]|uniref:Uncharacterized protein n=1 Tax=Vecturithrix granuli TaxID=1499967 RepID=A0A081BX22_VECG1|nr:hypothetical protein U27_03841 [Candidatus Vecturithrix granuli]
MTPMMYVVLVAVAAVAAICFLAILAAIPMAPVQRLMMYVTPTWLLNIMCFFCPKTVIGLLCHWLNEKNPDLGERGLAPRRINPVPVSKKMSKLSVLGILYLLRQDESLWKFFAPNPKGGKVINLQPLPYILLELMFDLGGPEGREKVSKVIQKCRMTLGGVKQTEILQNFKVDNVIELFEMFPPGEVNMCLKNQRSAEVVAFWLYHWDLRKQKAEAPIISPYWIGQLPANQASEVQRALGHTELRGEGRRDLYKFHDVHYQL